MEFKLDEALEILSRTPGTLKGLLAGLSANWVNSTEGPDTWSPYDVVGHLISAEKTNWMLRVNSILEHGKSRTFVPFDRVAHFETSKGKSLDSLLAEFAALHKQNIQKLRDLDLSEQDLEKLGGHPEFGDVRLSELLATWVVHDLSHIRQIVQTMARQYETEVGPWRAYLSIFKE